MNIFTNLQKCLNQAETTFKVASFKFSPNTPLSPWLNINFFTHQYFGNSFFWNRNEDQHFDHFWSSLTISKLHIHPLWALGKKLSILKSETLTQTRKSYEILCEKKTVEFNTYRTGLNCWSCSETLHFTFSQPFNNLLCYFCWWVYYKWQRFACWATKFHPVSNLSVTDLKLGRLPLKSQGSKHFRVLFSCLAPTHKRWSTVLAIIGTPLCNYKIPSKMEVAPRYNCGHCCHYWHC